MKLRKGSRGNAALTLNVRKRWRGTVKFRPWPLYPWYLLTRQLAGLQYWSGCFGEKTFSPVGNWSPAHYYCGNCTIPASLESEALLGKGCILSEESNMSVVFVSAMQMCLISSFLKTVHFFLVSVYQQICSSVRHTFQYTEVWKQFQIMMQLSFI